MIWAICKQAELDIEMVVIFTRPQDQSSYLTSEVSDSADLPVGDMLVALSSQLVARGCTIMDLP